MTPSRGGESWGGFVQRDDIKRLVITTKPSRVSEGQQNGHPTTALPDEDSMRQSALHLETEKENGRDRDYRANVFQPTPQRPTADPSLAGLLPYFSDVTSAYYMTPTRDQLLHRLRRQVAAEGSDKPTELMVDDFVVGKKGCGEVMFLYPVNVIGLVRAVF